MITIDNDKNNSNAPTEAKVLLEDLIKKISFASVMDDMTPIEAKKNNKDFIPTKQDVIDAQKKIGIRTRKESLVNKGPHEILDLFQEISKNKSKYVNNEVIPLLVESLQVDNILSMLTIIRTSYTDNGTPNEDPALLDEETRNALFRQKKDNVRAKIRELYNSKYLDGRLLFGIFLLLSQEEDLPISLEKFKEGTFLNDMKKRMYSGDRVRESFWNRITESAPQKQEAQVVGSNGIAETLG